MSDKTPKSLIIASMFRLAISFALIVAHVYALAIDVWIAELKIPSHNNEIIQQLGIWEVCWTTRNCIETADTFYHNLKDVTENTAGWLFHVQMLSTLGTIMLGYGIIVILRRIVNFGGCGLKYFYLFVVVSLVCNLSATVLFAYSVFHYFGAHNFRWGISFKINFTAMCINFVCFVALLPICNLLSRGYNIVGASVCCCHDNENDDDFLPLEFENLTSSSATWQEWRHEWRNDDKMIIISENIRTTSLPSSWKYGEIYDYFYHREHAFITIWSIFTILCAKQPH